MITNQIYKLRFTEVVVMEDDSETRHLIYRVFKEMGFTEVIFVDSTDAVIELAVVGKLQNFILDIHMGDKRPQEGLDALEILKDIDNDIFVAILSGHPSVDRRRAERLKVNIFQSKSSNLELDIKSIVNVMLHHLQSKLEIIMQMEAQAIAPYSSPFSTVKAGKKITSIRNGELIDRLRTIKPGQKEASEYQREMLYILNHLFNPDLIDGKMEEATIDGTERRDIIFTNDSDQSFWRYVREQYNNYLVMFEAKNVRQLNSNHINQVNTYLGDRIGRLGFIVTRNPPSEAQIRKTITIFNDNRPRKVILILHDEDIVRMFHLQWQGKSPTKYIQQIYRAFKLRLQ